MSASRFVRRYGYIADMRTYEKFAAATSADIVAASFDHAQDPRLREVAQSLVRHLHAFVVDVGLTQSEWELAIDFLTRTGHLCDGERQEFILLSDVLGVSMLVDAIANETASSATDSTVLGPFHVVDSPPRSAGDSITTSQSGEPCVITGRVVSTTGEPLPGAVVDVWQADDAGFYDIQSAEVERGELRGLFTADEDGEFWFRSIVPAAYPIPHDGPVGQLLEASGRHPWRPAHIHFIAGAVGHRPLTTHIFVAGSDYLDSDAVFGVKPSLIKEFRTVTDAGTLPDGVATPVRHCHFEIVLEREEA
jgi:catechol 1,2-dioxygenase